VEKPSLGILEGYVRISQLAKALGEVVGRPVSQRYIRDNINCPDGWPYVVVAGVKLLHAPTICDIIQAETKPRNPRRPIQPQEAHRNQWKPGGSRRRHYKPAIAAE
jgi:hypothetical protein